MKKYPDNWYKLNSGEFIHIVRVGEELYVNGVLLKGVVFLMKL